ncbi:MAG TPA: hypothetical protein VIV64_04485 [Gammaproteobacteria bacterium]|jgi:hypothetical protein
MKELCRTIGREQPLDQFHWILKQAAVEDPAIETFGCGLVTCADERQGQTRSSFDREVATPLIPDAANPRDHVFSISNLGGRYENGALRLLDEHFTRLSPGPRRLVVEIASHVGRVEQDGNVEYGSVERFGRKSTCCGALTALLAPLATVPVARHSWLDEVDSSFGPERLAALREIDGPTRLVAAAVIHAALQAEAAVSDLLQSPLAAPVDVLLVAGVSINRQSADGFLPVACHHLTAGEGAAQLVAGYSLGTTPRALSIDTSAAGVVVDSGQAMAVTPR